MANIPKEPVLDYKKWVCGDPTNSKNRDPDTCSGEGATQLLNSHGYMCCLGQWMQQGGCTKKELLHVGEPSDVEGSKVGERFAVHAIRINDDKNTTIAKKVKALRSLCSKFKRKLKLKNFPKRILKEIG